MALSRFESMLKTNKVYFFDSLEFEEIIHHYIDDGRHSLAKKALKLGLEQHPTSVTLKLLKAELHVMDGSFQEAEKLLNELQALEPTNEEVYIQRAAILSKRDQHIEAIDSLKTAMQHTNDPADVLSLLAMEFLFLDNFSEARLHFEKCLDLDPEDYASLYNLIYCYDMDEKHEAAITYLNKYLDANPYCEIAWHQLGRQYMVAKDYEQALRAFDYAVLIDESFIGGYLEKAKTLELLGRYKEAIENYGVTLQLDDPTAFVYQRIGGCYRKINQHNKAVEFYNKAVVEDPLLDKAWVALSELYFNKQDYSKSLYYIKKAISIDEFNALYWTKCAEINLKLSFYEECIVAFKQCLSIEGQKLEIWLALVDVLYYLGDYKEALKYLVKSKNIYKEDAAVEYRLFGLLMEVDEGETALMHLKNGLALDFEFVQIAKELFPHFFKLKKVKLIVLEFQK